MVRLPNEPVIPREGGDITIEDEGDGPPYASQWAIWPCSQCSALLRNGEQREAVSPHYRHEHGVS